MKKFLTILLVIVAVVGSVRVLNWFKKAFETEGETFTVLYSKNYTNHGWFGIKSERCIMVATTPSTSNIYHFDESKLKVLPQGSTFTISFGRVKALSTTTNRFSKPPDD
jgi:hypothetical protein